MKIQIQQERKSLVMKVLSQDKLKQGVDFPRNDIADLQTDYTGPSPYHLNYCGYEHCHAGYAFGPHTRTSYLLHLVTRGTGTYYVDDHVYEISAGQIFLIYPGVTTTYQASLDDPWSYYWIGFSGYQANYILEQMGFSEHSHVISIEDIDPLVSCIEQMLQFHEITFANELERTAELLKFFSHVINSHPHNLVSAKNYRSQYAEVAMRYISNNFDSKIRIADLADYIGVDRSYLSKAFHAEYQISPQEYLLRLRMQHATNLLANSKLSITDVAAKCGYPDALAFTKIFRQRLGCSPRDYRLAQNSEE